MKNKRLRQSPENSSVKPHKGYTKTMKKTSSKKRLLTYDTPVSVVEKNQNVRLGVNPNTKLGDYLTKVGFPSLAEMLKA